MLFWFAKIFLEVIRTNRICSDSGSVGNLPASSLDVFGFQIQDGHAGCVY